MGLVEGRLGLPAVLPPRTPRPARQARSTIVAFLGSLDHDGAVRGTARASSPVPSRSSSVRSLVLGLLVRAHVLSRRRRMDRGGVGVSTRNGIAREALVRMSIGQCRVQEGEERMTRARLEHTVRGAQG